MRAPRVIPVPSAALIPVRHPVLRPGLPVSTASFEGDDHPEAIHLAVEVEGALVGVASLIPAQWEGAPALQLRGMAVLEAHQRRGLGTLLVREALDAARQAAARVVWCNARVRAVPLYLRAGFEEIGAPFEIPGVGPHLRLWIRLTPSSG
ncbi:MAG: GNAT family N-acetyltransferase [Deltaproteobacteria bacterium]|nr:GNAT family N-acetyltransferase [Deltaproteobacteria bacterium]